MQWGNNLWPMLVIWVIGLITIWRVKRAHITLTYIASFLLLAFARSYFTGDSFLAEAAPITGPMYQLFALFMITDPKTTVSSKTGEVIVTVIIAIVELFLRLGEVVYAPFYALFIVGPIAMLIEIYWMDGDTTSAETTEERVPADAPEEAASVAGAAA
jgi:Na+-translocating ferredoxin:NAD+ oxidoreductase RnfD subunit